MLRAELMISEKILIENSKLYSSIYSDFINNKASLRETTGNKTSVLIYRYAKYMCESCILEDLQEIELFQEETGKEKILLLPAYPDNRMGMIELSNVLAKHNFVNIPLDSFVIPLYEGDYIQRYFAVIDKEGNLTMVFFPRRGDTALTRLYFSEVKKMIVDL